MIAMHHISTERVELLTEEMIKEKEDLKQVSFIESSKTSPELQPLITPKIGSEYFKLALELAGKDESPANEEAKLRSSVSRAYFAAYCMARNYLIELRIHRKLADYQDYVGKLSSMANNSLNLTREVISALRKIQ